MFKRLRNSSLFKIGALAVFMGVGIGTYYYFKQKARLPISILEFSDVRDSSFILDIFEKDWWWLVSEYSKDFSPEYMLEYRASSKKPQHKGNLVIKAAYENEKPVGFLVYYKKSFYYGYILFVDILPEFRKKGYAKALMEHGINDLKERGVSKIGLVTRTTNYPAMALYKKLGFKEISRSDGFVNFEYVVK